MKYMEDERQRLVAKFIENGPLRANIRNTTDNSKTSISIVQSSAQIPEYSDQGGIPGLLQPTYAVPSEVHA